jgi:acyl dehydratase
MALRGRDQAVDYGDRDVMLYALAVGMGRDPLNRDELPYVYEGNGLRVVPAFASLLATTSILDDCGWDYSRVLHGEERLVLHRPLPETGELLVDSRVSGVRDLGAGRGAFIEVELRGRARDQGTPLFTVLRTIVARGDGGFGGPGERLRPLHALPARAPDLTSSLQTRRDQALLYRLTGDRNPLHADPVLARKLGLAAPILHGLCTWGIACRAILRTICEYDQTLIRSLEGRFSAPVIPGETLITEMWQEANIVSFRVRAAERDLVVLNHGRCELTT